MENTDRDMIIKSRSIATDTERKVLALEQIADNLGKIVTKLSEANLVINAETVKIDYKPSSASEDWENEGGALGKNTLESFGITHSFIDQFEIDGFRYSKIEDAILQAKRGRPYK